MEVQQECAGELGARAADEHSDTVTEGILPSSAGRLVVAVAQWPSHPPFWVGVCLGVGRWTALGAALLRGPTGCWVGSPTSSSRRPCQRVRLRSLRASTLLPRLLWERR